MRRRKLMQLFTVSSIGAIAGCSSSEDSPPEDTESPSPSRDMLNIIDEEYEPRAYGDPAIRFNLENTGKIPISVSIQVKFILSGYNIKNREHVTISPGERETLPVVHPAYSSGENMVDYEVVDVIVSEPL